MMPAEPEQPGREATPEPVSMAQLPRWYHKAWAVLLITFCVEIGLFLVIFPWTEAWDVNYFANSITRIREYWDNMYLRGAVSGLGVINLYIAATEAARLRRFSKQQH